MKGLRFTEMQQKVISALRSQFKTEPSLKTCRGGIKVSFFTNSRIRNFNSVRFRHSYVIDKNGNIVSKIVKIKRRSNAGKKSY